MGFTVDTNNTQEQQGLIKPGDYEVVIKEVKEGASQQKGTPFIQIELVVRNDVNQEFKNKHLWYTIWDTPATREKGMYAKQINTVSKHAGVQNGANFNSVADWGKFITGRPVLATVKHEEYNGEQKERVTFINATKFPQCQHSWKQEDNTANQNNNSYSQPTNNQNSNNQVSYNNNQNVAGTGQAWQGNNTQQQDDDLPF
ncbi:MAG: DUF669 domain-containing protein [Clostridium lundense]|nr:DUF669 domain-containing protein [Clostridium lundense]